MWCSDPTRSTPGKAVDAVAVGTHDLALVHNWEPLPLAIPDHLDVRDLGRDRADVLVHVDHRLAGRQSLTVHDVVDETWASVAPGSICHQWLQKMYFDIGRSPRIGHIALEFATHVALVERGESIALVPRLGRGPLPDSVVAVPIVEPVSERTVSLVWRRTMTARPALAVVIDALAAEGSHDLT